MRQFAIDRCDLTWNGLDFKEGLAQGTMVTEARTSKTWSFKPTGMGRGVRIKNPDKSGVLSVTVDQESKLHQQLRDFAQQDETTLLVVKPFVIKDNNTGEVFNYLNTYIITQPDESRGTESAVFTWEFQYESFSKNAIPADNNVVGS